MLRPNIYVIDDDDAIRDSLEWLLQAHGFAVRSFASGPEFLAELPLLSFGALLVDLQMPGMHGLELQSRLAELNIKLPVVVITAHGDVSSAVRAMRGGAADFVEKPFTSQEILRSIGIALGEGGAPPQTDQRREAITRRIKMLSGREREVMLGMVSGKPNKAIANHLGLSPRTVEIHRARVMTKMEAGSLSELVRTALAAGVVPAG